MSDKLSIPISDQPYYDDSPIGAIKDWHIGVDSRARGTANISGICGADTTNKLTYSAGGFTLNVTVGDIVYNSTDDVYAFVTAKDSDTVLTLDWDAFPDGNEDFEIYTPTVPGYGWKRLDTDLTVDDTTSPYYGLTIKAQKAKITEGYDTGWVANSDWTNAELTVTHNLNANLSDLIVKFYISTDGTEANAFEIKDNTRVYNVESSTDTSYGFSIFENSVNSIKVQTATDGLRYILDTGSMGVLDTESYYYKVKVYRKQDVGIIPIMKVSAGLAVVGSLAVDSLIVNGQDYATQRYTTGWVANSDWTNAEFTVNHNLGYNLSDLIVKFYISTDGTEANALEIIDVNRDLSSSFLRGASIHNNSINSLSVHTAIDGITYIATDGTSASLLSTLAYYKVVVYAPHAIDRYYEVPETEIDYGTAKGTNGQATSPNYLRYTNPSITKSSNTYSIDHTFTTPAAGLWVWTISAGVYGTTAGEIALLIDGVLYAASAGYTNYSPALQATYMIELDGATDVAFQSSRTDDGGSASFWQVAVTGYRIR